MFVETCSAACEGWNINLFLKQEQRTKEKSDYIKIIIKILNYIKIKKINLTILKLRKTIP